MAKDTSYVSNTTKFINSLFEKNAQLTQEQQKLRNTWWNKDDLVQEEQTGFKQSTIKAQPYAYYTYNNKK